MLDKPLVTVCMPVFNDEKTIQVAVESVLNQNYKNLEILISDNLSEDRTYEIIKQFNDPRINATQNIANQGWRGNSNKLLRMAKGEYIVTLHGDDYYKRPDYIEKVIQIFNDNSSVGIISFVPEVHAVEQFGRQGFINREHYLYRITSVKYTPAPTVTAFRGKALTNSRHYAKHYWSSEIRLSVEMSLAGYDAFMEGDPSYFHRYQGPEKDSSIPLRRSERLEHLYILYKDLKKENRFKFNTEEFEDSLMAEINLLAQNQHIDVISESLRNNIFRILNEKLVSDKLINSINSLIVKE